MGSTKDDEQGPTFSDLLDRAAAQVKITGYQPPVRIVSYERYHAAELAIEAGATPREIELILMGATPEQARKFLEGNDDKGS